MVVTHYVCIGYHCLFSIFHLLLSYFIVVLVGFFVVFFGCHRYFNFVVIVYHSFVSVFMVVTLYFCDCIGYHFYFEWLTLITFILNIIVVFKKLQQQQKCFECVSVEHLVPFFSNKQMVWYQFLFSFSSFVCIVNMKFPVA